MIKGADNINRKPYLGSTEIKQAWLGNILVYPETLYGLRKFSNLGNVAYYYDMGDGLHFATKLAAFRTFNIYRYDDKSDDVLLYNSDNLYIMTVDGFFYNLTENKLYRFDENDNLEEWSKNFDGSLVISEMVKFGENYYARMNITTTTSSTRWYSISLDFETKTINRNSTYATISSYMLPDDNVHWDRIVNEENKTVRLYNNGLAVFANDIKVSSTLKTSIGTEISWSWVGTLNGNYYGIGAHSTSATIPYFYTIDVNNRSWTNTRLTTITENIYEGASWQKITLNGEEMLYINCVSSSSTFNYVPNVSYLLRIVDGQPVIKKYENNPYVTLSQFTDKNLFICSGYDKKTSQNASTTIYKTYVVKFDDDLNIVLLDEVDEYSADIYTGYNCQLPVWKFNNKSYLFGRPFKYISEV